MNTILNDKTYELTKKFIQDKITLDLLSDSTKEHFVTLYKYLTPTNATVTYDVSV